MEFNKEIVKKLLEDALLGLDEAVIKESFWQIKASLDDKNQEFLMNLVHLQRQIKELEEWIDFLHKHE